MWYAVIAILVLVIDQVTKIAVAAASKAISGIEPGMLGSGKVLVKKIIDGFIEIEYCENNKGMMGIFGFLSNGRVVFIIATILILAGMIVYMCLSKNRGKWLNTTLALIISGALGNFIDRVFTKGGYVRDMIHVIIEINGKEYFPYIFNVADIALVVGAIMLIIYILFIGKDAVFCSKARRERLAEEEADGKKKIAEAKQIFVDKENEQSERDNAENNVLNTENNALNAKNDGLNANGNPENIGKTNGN